MPTKSEYLTLTGVLALAGLIPLALSSLVITMMTMNTRHKSQVFMIGFIIALASIWRTYTMVLPVINARILLRSQPHIETDTLIDHIGLEHPEKIKELL